MTSCRQLIESGPSASTMIEDAHAAAVQLSETIQSLGSGKSNTTPPISGGRGQYLGTLVQCHEL